MMEGHGDIENNCRNTLLAQIFACFLQCFPWTRYNKLLGSVVVGYVNVRPLLLQVFDDIQSGIHAHHACFAAGPGFQFRDVPGPCLQDVPAGFRRVDTCQAERNKLAQ